MAEEMPRFELPPQLRWPQWPWPPGDPPPDIWLIIRQLDVQVQREVAAVVLQTHVTIEEARLEGLKKVAGLLGPRVR
jgi:hypothetical protein